MKMPLRKVVGCDEKNCWLWRESRWSNRFNLVWVKEWDCCQLFHENRWEMPELFMWRRRLLWAGTGWLCRLQKPSTKLAFLPRHPCCNTPCVGYMYTLAVYYRVLYATFLFEEEIPYTVWSLSGSTLLISETSTLYYGVISATNNFL